MKDGVHSIQVELFRRKTLQTEERVLIGEAAITTSYVLHTVDSHLIVEVLRNKTDIAATVLLKIEKFDSKGRALSTKSSPASSLPASSSSTKSAEASSTLHLPDFSDTSSKRN